MMKTVLPILLFTTIVSFAFTGSEECKEATSFLIKRREFDIFMIVTEWSSIRRKQLSDCMRTMQLHHNAKFDIHFHVLVDITTRDHVLDILGQWWCQSERSGIKVSTYNMQVVEQKILYYHRNMMKFFSNKSNLYYNRTIFFVEAVLHMVLPKEVKKVMVFDIDIKFNSSVEILYHHFQYFSPSNLMGLAFEQQPTYMHYTTEYRKHNPFTQIGRPPPAGIPGFNSGVMLMNLEAIRSCETYNDLLSSPNLQKIVDKYFFHGNLGDQDYFTLLSFEYPEFFYVLPCTWNRQLCRWFEVHGYQKYFNKFHDCQGNVHIYHGNCNSTLPEL